MTKRRSIGLFVVFSIILAICLFFCFADFTYGLPIKGNYYSYSSFLSNLRLGEDVGKYVKVTYRADLPENKTVADYERLREYTMMDIESILRSEGYQDVTVSKVGEDGLAVNVGNIVTEDDKSAVLDLIGNPNTISFYTAEKSDDSTPLALASDVKEVYAYDYYDRTTGETTYCVYVSFNDDKVAEIAEKTASGGTLYVYMGEEIFAQISYTDGIDSGYIMIQNEAFTSHDLANTYANRIRTGMLDLELTQLDGAIITPNYGIRADIWLLVAFVILLVFSFVYLIVKFRDLGGLTCFALTFFMVIGLFLLQSIPFVHLNLSGMIALMIMFLLCMDSMVAIINRAKEMYNNDTKLFIAFKSAQKDNLASSLILHAVLFVIGLVSLLMPNMAIQSFGWVVMVLSLVSAFVVHVLMKLFIKLYLGINNLDGKKCNFHKGGQKNAQ